MCSCKCCRCCSFESLGCRLRTLKASASFLIIFGVVFAVAGVLIGFVGEFHFQQFDFDSIGHDVYPKYTLLTWLVVSTGFSAIVTGMGAIYVSRTMSDDDCSTYGLSVLALLTITCSLASVGVPAWQLYIDGYFIWNPEAQGGLINMTTPEPAQSTMANSSPLLPMSTPASMATMNVTLDVGGENTTAMTANMTSMSMGGATDSPQTASSNASVSNSTMSNVTDMQTSTPAAGGANATAPEVSNNSTVAESITNSTSTPESENSTAAQNATSGTMQNATSGTMQNATSGSMQTATDVSPDPVTPDYSTGTIGNSTDSSVKRQPIEYEEWLAVIAPFGIICIFALIFIIFGLLIFCISCCCAERSEIVDDIDLYKR